VLPINAKSMKGFYLACFSFFLISICFAQSVKVYPPPTPNFRKVSDKYVVTIIQNGIFKKSFVYKSSAGQGERREWGTEQNNNFHFTNFSFSGVITLEIVKFNSSASLAILRPNRLGIGTIETVSEHLNKKISFKLNKAAKISVEFNDDTAYKDALMLFADKPENTIDVPDKLAPNILFVRDSASLKNIPNNKNVVYFKPGIYNIGIWNIPTSINQVYFEGGSYVQGYLKNESDNTIKINGRGILSNEGYPYHYPSTAGLHDNATRSWYSPINITKGQNHIIEGLTIIEATGVNIVINANNVLIQNIKINGFRYNNDGIIIHGSGNKIEDCFMRVNDDGIAVYASHLTVNNCIFWELQGSIFQLGWTPHSMEHITITNCDVVHDKGISSEGNVGFINAMNYTTANDVAIIKDFNISNIYFDTPILRFIDIRANRNFELQDYAPSSDFLPWIYQNFHFTNIHFNQVTNKYPLVYLHGYSDDYPISNFTFENIYVNNIKVSNDKLNSSLFIHTKNIKELQIK